MYAPIEFRNDRLRQLRESKYPTPAIKIEAEMMGLSRETLRRYENGEREPTFSALMAICDYYGVTPDFFTMPTRKNNFGFGTVRCQPQ